MDGELTTATNNEDVGVICQGQKGDPLAEIDYEGVTVFEHFDFTGYSTIIGSGRYDWVDDIEVPNDSISAFEVSSGCCVTFYQHYAFEGMDATYCGPARDTFGETEWDE